MDSRLINKRNVRNLGVNDKVYEELGQKLATLRMTEPTVTLANNTPSPSGSLPWYAGMVKKDEKEFSTVPVSNSHNQFDGNIWDCKIFAAFPGYGSHFSGSLDSDEEDFAKEFAPETPPPNYVCKSCGIAGHYIKHCPKLPLNSTTPYLGPNRSVGVFVCKKCKREWISKNSYSQQGQQCNKCRIVVTPKKQYPMEKAFRCGIYPNRRDRRNSSACSSGYVSSEGPSPVVSPFATNYHETTMFPF